MIKLACPVMSSSRPSRTHSVVLAQDSEASQVLRASMTSSVKVVGNSRVLLETFSRSSRSFSAVKEAKEDPEGRKRK